MKRSICFYLFCFALIAGAGLVFTGCGGAENPAEELDAKTMTTEKTGGEAADHSIPDDTFYANGGYSPIIYVMGAYNGGSQWINVNINDNFILNANYNYPTIGINVFDSNVAHIYNNTLNSLENNDPSNPNYYYNGGIQATRNNETEINNNPLYGPLIGTWILFSYDCGSTNANSWVYNNLDSGASAYIGAFSKAVEFVQDHGCTYCPSSQVIIGKNRLNSCLGSNLQHRFLVNCSPTPNLSDCN